MIKLNNVLPVDVDVSDPMQLHDFLVACKQAIEELAEKAKEIQSTLYTTAPVLADMEEGSDAQFDDGANRREYTKTNGALRYKTMT